MNTEFGLSSHKRVNVFLRKRVKITGLDLQNEKSDFACFETVYYFSKNHIALRWVNLFQSQQITQSTLKLFSVDCILSKIVLQE